MAGRNCEKRQMDAQEVPMAPVIKVDMRSTERKSEERDVMGAL